MLKEWDSKGIAVALFIATTFGSAYFLKTLNYSDAMGLASGFFAGIIVAAIWLEVSMRFLVKEATAPLDKLLSR